MKEHVGRFHGCEVVVPLRANDSIEKFDMLSIDLAIRRAVECNLFQISIYLDNTCDLDHAMRIDAGPELPYYYGRANRRWTEETRTELIDQLHLKFKNDSSVRIEFESCSEKMVES